MKSRIEIDYQLNLTIKCPGPTAAQYDLRQLPFRSSVRSSVYFSALGPGDVTKILNRQ